MEDRGTSPLILASASPRRRDLLAAAGVPIEVVPSTVEEETREGESAAHCACRLAREKAMEVASRPDTGATRTVLGADTLVVLGTRLLGKPRDAENAVELLRMLAGHRHQVVTGVALVSGPERRVLELSVTSQVVFRPAEEAELRAYVATGEPLDKAGAYAAQGEGRLFVDRIEGSESNVIGLPIEETLAALAQVGFQWSAPS